MSRIGKKLIPVPTTVKVAFDGPVITVTGPKGELKTTIHRDIKAELKDGNILVAPQKKEASKKAKGLWGLYRALIFNMVNGVDKGFEKKLEIEGVGYKAAVQGEELVLNLGFVNPVKIKKPQGIEFLVEKNLITVSGINKEVVGQSPLLSEMQSQQNHTKERELNIREKKSEEKKVRKWLPLRNRNLLHKFI